MKRETLFNDVQEQFHSTPEYLWSNFPRYAVFRHHESAKWFGIVMDIPREKLGLKTNEKVDVLDVKVKPEHVEALRKQDGIFSAYHMNKKHWVSILLSGPLPIKTIQELLAESYKLTS